MGHVSVATFYRFARLDAAGRREPLAAFCAEHGIRGTVILAPEGVNGTIAGARDAVDAVLGHLQTWPGFAEIEARRSRALVQPFGRLKVRCKREIVTFGWPYADPTRTVGVRVAPQYWNDLIQDRDVAVIDTRNAYEVAIGTFDGAIDPGTASFRDFPGWWRENHDRFNGRRVAMFCTGGIRCEKASSFLLGEGVPEVLHLQGGILGYLEQVGVDASLWSGDCFVFDGRVAVGHGMVPGTHSLCHACGGAVSQADRAHCAYEPGVSCPACVGIYDERRRRAFRERQRQIALAAGRGERHLAASFPR